MDLNAETVELQRRFEGFINTINKEPARDLVKSINLCVVCQCISI